jgi:hypothetical protein
MAGETIIRIRYEPEESQDGDLYLVICTELGLAANGQNRKEAIHSLNAAIRSYCAALDRAGQLAKALSESRIQWEEVPVERGPKEVVMELDAAA